MSISDSLQLRSVTLQEFFAATPGAQAALAKAIGAHAPDLSRWASGGRPVPVPRCVPIERYTAGRVPRWKLRPQDWHLIWPELVGAVGAPPVEAVAQPCQHLERAA